MEKYFADHPLRKTAFEQQQLAFQKKYEVVRRERNNIAPNRRLSGIVTIPVVVHIVLENPSLVTDEQVQGQIDVLNKDYGGDNADSINIPAAFKPLFGKSRLRFCLAQRAPDNTATNGITRLSSLTQSLPGEQDPIKYTAKGGADNWNPDEYLNIWVCRMDGDQYLGYTFLPGLGIARAEMGCVISYLGFGTTGTAHEPFNKGRTVTHEVGHYFDLAHIWGANGCIASCTDSDDVDDTPNEDKCFYGSPSFPQTDNCNTTTPGVMFMDYMDYSDDAVMCMFSEGQVDRMETAITSFSELTPLLNANGCVPVAIYNNDVAAQQILLGDNGITYCDNQVVPRLQIKNTGSLMLSSVLINISVDGQPAVSKAISLQLPSQQTTTITGDALSLSEGYHTIKLYTTLPNGVDDQFTANDTVENVCYATGTTGAPVKEGFESSFPPAGWGISNTTGNKSYNPVSVSNAYHSGQYSLKFDNYHYQLFGNYALLSTPGMNIPSNADSVKITFWRAAAQTVSFYSDTLNILFSTDCGQTFTSAYKKAGASLSTHNGVIDADYVPSAGEWVTDTVDLSPYIAGKYSDVIVQFRDINGYGNNVYLDDINIYAVVLPPALKQKGHLLSPNPTTGQLLLQHYPSASGLQAVKVYSATGQLVWKADFSNAIPPGRLPINISNVATGIYFVKIFYSDRTAVTQKVLKIN
ncbi:MAG: zinc-dependent metalloprotease [Sphingobacteriales bacterium]|nr:zinc-dependent metalloprotease [Sphingobacteriales bacterium]